MGIEVKIALLICFCVPAFSTSPAETLHLDHELQGNMKYTTVCGKGIAHPDKFGHASGGRGAAVGGGHPNDGESQSSYTQGGSAIPLYTAGAAAGAANDHRNNNRNHSGSSRNYGTMGVVTFAFTLLACILLRQDV